METINCGQARASHIGSKVSLYGWCRLLRDHGGKLFIDLSDRYGTTQLVFDGAAKTEAEKLGREYVIHALGTVRERSPDTVDNESKTGAVEVAVEYFELISESRVPPFELIPEKGRFLADEELRLRHRYLDLRRPKAVHNIVFRDAVTKEIRKFLWGRDFLELETPLLIKDTYETGARTFLVPSRLHKGKFYALPQSPQLFKQMCMIGGLDRYFQIARCFRDEDPREDRQPEFTQVDMEVSFKDEEYIMSIVEDMIASIFRNVLGKEIKVPFARMNYAEAFGTYGSDKPDLRFGARIEDVTREVAACGYRIVKRVADNGGRVRAMRFKADFGKPGSRVTTKQMLGLVELAKGFGLGGLTWLYMDGGSVRSEPPSIADALGTAAAAIASKLGAGDGDVIVMGADLSDRFLLGALGKVRKALGDMIGDFSTDYSFVWIYGFPEFERDEITGALKPSHNPFTAPTTETLEHLDAEPERVIGRQYDLVLNGYELGSGSIRINNPELQRRVLRRIGMSDETIDRHFGFMLEALSYGAPIHGGVALGLDRLVALLAGEENIRDFILFPKNKRQELLVDGSPTPVGTDRLREDYGIGNAGPA